VTSNPALCRRQIFVAHQQFFINSSGDVGQQAGPLHFLKLSPPFSYIALRAWGEAEFYPGETCESETVAGTAKAGSHAFSARSSFLTIRDPSRRRVRRYAVTFWSR
jgi:hypothetical protein